MKILKIILLSFLASYNCFSQTEIIDYVFINSALKQVKKYDSTCFLVQRKIYKCYLHVSDFDIYKKELKGKIDTTILKEIFHNSLLIKEKSLELDPKLISNTIGANITPQSLVDSLLIDEYPLLPLNKKFVYTCSIPIFDNKKIFAIIEFGGGTRRNAMLGSKYLFKRIKNTWTLITTFDHWIS